MQITKTFTLSQETSFIVVEGEKYATLQVGKKRYAVESSDLMEFCKQFIGPSGLIGAGERAAALFAEPEKTVPKHPRRTDAPDLDSRKATSSTPIKQFSREDMIKMEKPLTPVDGVSFGTVDMAAVTGSKVSFKQD